MVTLLFKLFVSSLGNNLWFTNCANIAMKLLKSPVYAMKIKLQKRVYKFLVEHYTFGMMYDILELQYSTHIKFYTQNSEFNFYT